MERYDLANNATIPVIKWNVLITIILLKKWGDICSQTEGKETGRL